MPVGSRYRIAFPKRHTLLLSIHVSDCELVRRNAQIAYDEGADGIFLVNEHGMEELLLLAAEIHTFLPSLWIGVNCREQQPEEAFGSQFSPGINGIWTDSSAVYSYMQGAQLHARRVAKAREKNGSDALYFGGVAFKNQPAVHPRDVEIVAHEAIDYVDVITTSGDEQGEPPGVEKVKKIRAAIGKRFPFAIAGGIGTWNVCFFAELADCFIVASSVCRSPRSLDAALVQSLVRKIRTL